MQRISMTELKERLRKAFRDEHKIQWSDALLEEILFEAQREYALYSGGSTGKFDVFSGDSPVLSMPEDFFQATQIISPEGKALPIVSYRELAEEYGDFRKDKGSFAKAFCFNFDTFGKFRIYPQLPPDTFAGTVIYKRLPVVWDPDMKNSTAVEHYAMFLMYQFTGKALAQNAFAAFMDAIYKEQKQKLSSGSKQIARKGVFF